MEAGLFEGQLFWREGRFRLKKDRLCKIPCGEHRDLVKKKQNIALSFLRLSPSTQQKILQRERDNHPVNLTGTLSRLCPPPYHKKNLGTPSLQISENKFGFHFDRHYISIGLNKVYGIPSATYIARGRRKPILNFHPPVEKVSCTIRPSFRPSPVADAQWLYLLILVYMNKNKFNDR